MLAACCAICLKPATKFGRIAALKLLPSLLALLAAAAAIPGDDPMTTWPTRLFVPGPAAVGNGPYEHPEWAWVTGGLTVSGQQNIL
jgi:hypothetical protein